MISITTNSAANKTVSYEDRHQVNFPNKTLKLADKSHFVAPRVDRGSVSSISPKLSTQQNRLLTMTSGGEDESRQSTKNRNTVVPRAANHAYISLASQISTTQQNKSNTTGNASATSLLSKAEQRRKEAFDRSLQREVQKIEEVISHKHEAKQAALKRKLANAKAADATVGSIEGNSALINNYVDSLRVARDKQNIVNNV